LEGLSGVEEAFSKNFNSLRKGLASCAAAGKGKRGD
jgi:hypothetical protein